MYKLVIIIRILFLGDKLCKENTIYSLSMEYTFDNKHENEKGDSAALQQVARVNTLIA